MLQLADPHRMDDALLRRKFSFMHFVVCLYLVHLSSTLTL